MRWLWIVALLGCGRFAFDPGDRGDGSLGDRDSDGNGNGSGSGSDSGLDADASVPATCNQISRVHDDFEDGVVDLELWGGYFTQAGTSYAENGGHLVLTPASNAAATYIGFKTLRYYDLRGSRVVVEVAQVADPTATGNGASTSIGIDYDPDNYLHLSHKDGMLLVSKRLDGVYSELATVPYVAARDRFWSIRESNGMIAFETSTDGISFSPPIHELATPFAIDLVRMSMSAGTETARPAPGTARFAAVSAPSTQTACKAATFVDLFDDGEVGHAWELSYTDGCCSDSESGGKLTMAGNGANGYASRRSSAGYDLRDSEIVIRLERDPMVAGVSASLYVRADANNQLELLVTRTASATQTNSRVVVGGSAMNSSANRDATETYLRIREAAGVLTFAASTDRASWRTLRTVGTPFAVDDVMISVRQANSSAAGADQTVWSGLNAP